MKRELVDTKITKTVTEEKIDPSKETVSANDIGKSTTTVVTEKKVGKEAYVDLAGKCTCPPGLPYCVCGAKKEGNIITKKPILPSNQELELNSRSKSAKLRVFEKIWIRIKNKNVGAVAHGCPKKYKLK